ncbi:hypothetical protein NX722_23480 [Endozoicomonas gorgoniicola]|uniref:Uncharacterized protein n=1 Tax=Endozoicomonas gorgoniicola TaxID=1234144 RepID=A0ABT3N1L9_9GAMM|nr:hypothetical protein [Endozoicomonas gorgoniicola]MCW7555529.1 hypothetical protein [Endozoicomonas gorgoniicola]
MKRTFTDLITYTANLPELKKELVKKGYKNEDGSPYLPVCMTPVQHGDVLHSVTLCRICSEEERTLLNDLQYLEVLGTKEEVDADPAKTAKYKEGYSRDPVTYTDPETGETVTYTPPKWHGAFA